MSDNFNRAFSLVIGHEGGYVNHTRDPGGETKFGISKKQYPDLDIRSIMLDDAKEIYRRDYWKAAGCDTLPDGIDYAVFDIAVNQGQKTAIKVLQNAVRTRPDGVIGQATRRAITKAMQDPDALLQEITAQRVFRWMKLDKLDDDFGLGWARRGIEVHDRAQEIAGGK